MDGYVPCGAPTVAGGRCRWPRGQCRFHRPAEAPSERAGPPPRVPRGTPVSRRRDRRDGEGGLPRAVRERDVRGLAWWLMELLVSREDPAANAQALTAVLRVLAGLGPEPRQEEDALAEVELRGLLMHGVPPRTPGEWARAAELFSPEALREIARWEGLLAAGEGGGALLEGEGRDGFQPFRLRDARAEHLEVAGLIHDEDGVGGDGADGVAGGGFGAEVGAEPFDRDEAW